MARAYRALTAYLLLVFFLPPYCYSEPYDDFRRLIAAKEPFQSSELIQASLLFSGVNQRELKSYTAQFRKYLAEVSANVKLHSETDYEIGKALLTYLHETRLKRYDSSQSEMHTLFKKGKFNCLSSTVFYLLCARSLGLTVEPVRTPDHVFCRLKSGETWIDVETTTKYGFHPGIRNEFFDEFGRLTGATYIPPGNYRDRSVISERELLSLVLQARLPEKEPMVLRMAMDWFMLFPTRDADRNLQYAYSYYLDWLNDEDHDEHVITFVRHYKKRFESDPALRQSIQALLHRQILTFINKKQLGSAEQLLDEGTDVLPLQLKRSLAENLLAKAMQEGKRKKEYASALNLTSRLVAKGHLAHARAEDYLTYLQAQQSQVMSRGK